MYVPFFRCESFPYISRRADWFPCALFPLPSSCTPLVFISVPCMSLSVPLCFPFMSRCFPVMSTSYFLPSFPCTSLHFPFAPQMLPAKKHGFFCVFTIRIPYFLQKEAGTPNQQRAGRGNRAWDPCFATPAPRRLRLVERHQIAGGEAHCRGTYIPEKNWYLCGSRGPERIQYATMDDWSMVCFFGGLSCG